MSFLRTHVFSRDAWHPMKPNGGYALPHIGLILIIVFVYILGVGTGWQAKTTYDALFFQKHYETDKTLTAMSKNLPSSVYAPRAPKTIEAASIDISRYPAVGNQQRQGACYSWATAWVLSYDYRLTHPNHPGIRFSPAFLYAYYSDTYSGGADQGSWSPALDPVSTIGVPQFKVYPAPHDPNEYPFSSVTSHATVMANAAKYVQPVAAQTIYQGRDSSLIVDEVASAIKQGQPALLSIDVTPSFDNASQTNGLVGYQGDETSRGGHEIVALAIDPTKPMPDGTVGAVYIQNQWSHWYGVDGRAWLSFRWLAAHGWAVQMLTFGAHAPGGSPMPPVFTPSHGKTFRLSHGPLPPRTSRHPYWVHHVILRDTGQNATRLFNRYGKQYGIAPYNLVAVAATESGLRAVAPHNWGGVDVSAGLMQFTDQTAEGLHVCSDHASCAAYLDNPAHSIRLGAQFLAEAKRLSCEVFPKVYTAYNQGFYLGCRASQYEYPQGQAYSNYQNFLSNRAYVLATYT